MTSLGEDPAVSARGRPVPRSSAGLFWPVHDAAQLVSQLTVGVFRTPGRAAELDVADQRVGMCHHRPSCWCLICWYWGLSTKVPTVYWYAGFPVKFQWTNKPAVAIELRGFATL
jgi:hypothetical protein